jgi:hypothetical protein
MSIRRVFGEIRSYRFIHLYLFLEGKMKVSKASIAFVSGLLVLVALYSPLANAWTSTAAAPNVYTANSDNSSFFSTPSSLLNSYTITNVSWNVGPYPNGATVQRVEVCYTPYYGGSAQCENISNRLNGNTHRFDGNPAKGSYRITYNLSEDGTYPFYPSFTNTLTVECNATVTACQP